MHNYDAMISKFSENFNSPDIKDQEQMVAVKSQFHQSFDEKQLFQIITIISNNQLFHF